MIRKKIAVTFFVFTTIAFTAFGQIKFKVEQYSEYPFYAVIIFEYENQRSSLDVIYLGDNWFIGIAPTDQWEDYKNLELFVREFRSSSSVPNYVEFDITNVIPLVDKSDAGIFLLMRIEELSEEGKDLSAYDVRPLSFANYEYAQNTDFTLLYSRYELSLDYVATYETMTVDIGSLPIQFGAGAFTPDNTFNMVACMDYNQTNSGILYGLGWKMLFLSNKGDFVGTEVYPVEHIAHLITYFTGIQGVNILPAPTNFSVAENDIGNVKFTWEDLDPTIVDPNFDLQYVLYINDTEIEAIDPGEEEYDWNPIGFSDFKSPLTATLKVEDVMMNFLYGEEASLSFDLQTFPAPENFTIVSNTYGEVRLTWDDFESMNADLTDDLEYHLEINGQNAVIPQGVQTYTYNYSKSDINFSVDKVRIHAEMPDYPAGDEAELDLVLVAFPPVTNFRVDWSTSSVGELVLVWDDIDLTSYDIHLPSVSAYYKLKADNHWVADIPLGLQRYRYAYNPNSGIVTEEFELSLTILDQSVAMNSAPATLNSYLPTYQIENLQVLRSDAGEITFQWENNDNGLLSNDQNVYYLGINGDYIVSPITDTEYVYEFDLFHDPLPPSNGIMMIGVTNDRAKTLTIPAQLIFEYPAVPSPISFESRRLSENEIIFEWDYASTSQVDRSEISYILEIDGIREVIPQGVYSFNYRFDHNAKFGLARANLIAVAPNGRESQPETIPFSYDLNIPSPTEFEVEIKKLDKTLDATDVVFSWLDANNDPDLNYKVQVWDAMESKMLWEETVQAGVQSQIFSYDPGASNYWGPAVAKLWAENLVGQQSGILRREINLPIPTPARFRLTWISGDEVKFMWNDIDPAWMSASQQAGLIYHIKIGSWQQTVNQDTKEIVYNVNAQTSYNSTEQIARIWVEDHTSGASSLVDETTFTIPQRLVASASAASYVVPIVAGVGFTAGVLFVSYVSYKGYKAWKQKKITESLWDEYYETIELRDVAGLEFEDAIINTGFNSKTTLDAEAKRKEYFNKAKEMKQKLKCE